MEEKEKELFRQIIELLCYMNDGPPEATSLLVDKALECNINVFGYLDKSIE